MVSVSVVIPTYNRANTLSRAIDSILQQTVEDYEIIIVDDGSTDNTEEVVQSYKDTRVNYISYRGNKGANIARNIGIDKSTGDYIAFLDSDDEWQRDKLERQLSHIQKSDVQIVYTGIKYMSKNEKLIGIQHPTERGDLSRKLLYTNAIGSFSSIMVTKEVIEDVGKPEPSLPCLQDWEWYLRLSQNYRFEYISDLLTIKYSVEDQISNNHCLKVSVYPYIIEMLQKYSEDEREFKIILSYFQFGLGKSGLISEEYVSARRYFLAAINNNPLMWRSYVYLLLSGRHYHLLKDVKRNLTRIAYKINLS